ncbi:MAG: MliC family protein [Caulobacteraceae bacterium]
METPAGRPITADFQRGRTRIATQFEGGRLTIQAPDGHVYRLRQGVSGSGARYEGIDRPHAVTFWNKGREATFTVGAKTWPSCFQLR